MRKLTVKQKTYLDKLINRYKANYVPLYTVDDLQPDEWEELEKMNDTEILWQEANRYISDNHFEAV
jgi:hypothetical protein